MGQTTSLHIIRVSFTMDEGAVGEEKLNGWKELAMVVSELRGIGKIVFIASEVAARAICIVPRSNWTIYTAISICLTKLLAAVKNYTEIVRLSEIEIRGE